jgi:hypothetical protein
VTPHEIGMVLAKAAVFDQRNVGDSDILAWHEILGHVELGEALDAVGHHYADSRERIMPTDVLRLIPVLRHARQQSEHPCPRCGRVRGHGPDEVCGGQYAVASGRYEPTGKSAVREMLAQVATKLAVPNDDIDTSNIAPEVKGQLRKSPAAVRVVAEAQARVVRRQRDNAARLARRDVAGGTAWQATKTEPRGAWWEDPAAREGHATRLLAEAGRLHMHCQDPGCQQCSVCPCDKDEP